MRKWEYNSGFAPYIKGMIEFKHSDGFQYETEAWHLSKFDAFCMEKFPEATIVTKELSDAWCTKRENEGASFFSRRISALRQLCIYMTALGVNSYIPRVLTSGEKPILTIPTPEDMKEFFDVLDHRKTNKRIFRYIYAYRIMFRLYYCCGMRLSEVRLLRKEDTNLNNLVLSVKGSKGHKDRLIYLPENSKNVLSEYVSYTSNLFPYSPYLFPGQNPMKPANGVTIERMFRICWHETKASAKYEKEPTVHCLRHAFAVERINQWAAEGADFKVMIPYLSKYLGHATPNETFYYYHMLETAFATISEKGAATTDLIPEVIIYEEED